MTKITMTTATENENFTWLPVHLVTWSPGHLVTMRPGDLITWSPVHLSICPPVHLSTCPPIHLSTCPPVHLSTCPLVHLSTSQPVNLSTCLVCSTVCLNLNRTEQELWNCGIVDRLALHRVTIGTCFYTFLTPYHHSPHL